MTFSLSYKVILDWFKMFKPCLLPFAKLAVYSVFNSYLQEVCYVLVHIGDRQLITIAPISLAHFEGVDDVHCLCMQMGKQVRWIVKKIFSVTLETPMRTKKLEGFIPWCYSGRRVMVRRYVTL